MIAFNRAGWAYLCVALVFALGVWVALKIGANALSAPPDLNGQWVADSESASSITIEQSGKFVELTAPAGKLKLVLTQWNADSLQFAGDGWTLQADGMTPGQARFNFTAPAGASPIASGTYRLQNAPSQQAHN